MVRAVGDINCSGARMEVKPKRKRHPAGRALESTEEGNEAVKPKKTSCDVPDVIELLEKRTAGKIGTPCFRAPEIVSDG